MGRARVTARAARRSRSQPCIVVLDQGRLLASGTTDREDAIPPHRWRPQGGIRFVTQ